MLKDLLRGCRADRQSPQDVAPRDTDWCLDDFDICGNIVRVRGWLFDPANGHSENRILVLDEEGSKVVEVPTLAVGRPDIALHEQTLDAIWSGFEAFFYVVSPKPLYFFLAHCDDELRPIGTVLASDAAYTYVRPLSKEEADAGERPNGPSDAVGRPGVAGSSQAAGATSCPTSGVPAALAEYVSDASRPAILAITHALGGGAEQYLEWRGRREAERGNRFVVVRFDEDAGDFTYEAWCDGALVLGHAPDVETILASISNLTSVWVNEVVGYPNIAALLHYVAGFAESHGVALEFMVHDYGALCQSYNLMDAGGVFCNLPPYERCHACFSLLRRDDFAHAGIAEYRSVWESFLLRCDVITAFSEDSRVLLERAYPSLKGKGSIAVVPHEVSPLRRVEVAGDDGVVTVGVIGVLSHNKGLRVVRDIARLIDQNDTGLEIVVIGEATEEASELEGRQTGRYRREDLPDIIERAGVDVILIPSICPETFSFTATEAMDMGLPVAVFDIGAPAERVRRYGKGLVMDVEASPADVVDALRTLKASCS